MKTKLIVLLLILSSILIAKEDIFDYKTPFKKATIYLQKDGTAKGTEVIYIKDWGKYKATYTETETKFLGISHKDKTIEIVTPEWIYHLNLKDNSATKSHNPKIFMKEEYDKLSKADKKKFEENSKKFGKNMLVSFNGKITENAEKIMGYNCDRVEMTGVQIYNIHNTDITLRSESNIMGIKSKTEVVKIEKGKAPEEKFTLPKGIEPEFNEEADAMAKQMAQNMVHSIVEGNMEVEAKPVDNDAKKDNQQSDDDMKKAVQGLQKLFGN